MRSSRAFFAVFVAVVLAAAGVLASIPGAGAQAPWTCAADQSPNYYPCVALVTDLNCDDIGFSVHVSGGDPYDLDRDGDGIGCDAQYGAPVAVPTATPAPADPTPTPEAETPTAEPEGVTPTVDGQCLTLTFDTAGMAPVTIVTPDGDVTSLTTDQGVWSVDDSSALTFAPVANATFPTGVNLKATSNGQEVLVTATAECLDGRLVQVGVAPPTPAETETPTATEQSDSDQPLALAFTGSQTTELALAAAALMLTGAAAIAISRRIEE